MVGRHDHIREMRSLLNSSQAEFLVVTGRRRVGKTYLIDNVYEDNLAFQMTGIQNGNLSTQLLNFSQKLAEYSGAPYVSPAANWQEAFIQLKQYLQTLNKNKSHVIFMDELPWIYTIRSGFLQLLAHFWNDYLSKQKNFTLVICGSATSWIINKITNDKKGLHNRVTHSIHLQPFNLSEVQEYLVSRKIKLTRQNIAQIYMIMGGIPYYLKDIKKGESVPVMIERMCFRDGGLLKREYENLYHALFDNPQNHEAIVAVLSKSKDGLTRSQIIQKAKLKAGGPYTRAMEELMQSGFVIEEQPFNKKKRGSIYKINDEYSVFYHKFIKKNKKYIKGMWQQQSASQSYKIWCGYAFEMLCKKHIDSIKQSLGIASIYTEVSSLRVSSDNSHDERFQIDLIIDRKDATINLCEIKYHATSYKIDKAYASKLTWRQQRFREYTKTKKTIFNTLITNQGIVDNAYAMEVVDSTVELDALFEN